MLRKRIIFTLIYSNDCFMQSRNFRLQRVGDLKWLETNYKFQKISFSLDEIIVLNATKESKEIKKFAASISELVKNVFIPIAAGGGIRTINDAELLFKSGADKIVLNSMFLENPALIHELVNIYGSQSIVASIDYKLVEKHYIVYIKDGNMNTGVRLGDYISYLNNFNIGEIYLNSIDKDGTGFGYDLKVIEEVVDKIDVPLIIAGGAGNDKHLLEGLHLTGVNAVATANLFNFIGDGLPNARANILKTGENIANWNENE
jgi:cyclase